MPTSSGHSAKDERRWRFCTIKEPMAHGRDKRRSNAKRTARMRATLPAPQAQGPVDPPPDPYAPVLAPLKPKPSPRTGAVALPEPDDEEDSLAEITRTYG